MLFATFLHLFHPDQLPSRPTLMIFVFLTYSSVISGSVHFPSSELIRVKWILSSTKPGGVALLTKRSPTVEMCSLNISAMSARSSTTSPC